MTFTSAIIFIQWLRSHRWLFDMPLLVLLNTVPSVWHLLHVYEKWARPDPGAACGWQIVPTLKQQLFEGLDDGYKTP